jgi:hypothetical protein
LRHQEHVKPVASRGLFEDPNSRSLRALEAGATSGFRRHAERPVQNQNPMGSPAGCRGGWGSVGEKSPPNQVVRPWHRAGHCQRQSDEHGGPNYEEENLLDADPAKAFALRLEYKTHCRPANDYKSFPVDEVNENRHGGRTDGSGQSCGGRIEQEGQKQHPRNCHGSVSELSVPIGERLCRSTILVAKPFSARPVCQVPRERFAERCVRGQLNVIDLGIPAALLNGSEELAHTREITAANGQWIRRHIRQFFQTAEQRWLNKGEIQLRSIENMK